MNFNNMPIKTYTHTHSHAHTRRQKVQRNTMTRGLVQRKKGSRKGNHRKQEQKHKESRLTKG